MPENIIMTSLSDIYLAAPRGFCGGVRRAVKLVEQALRDYGAPIYVRHEIVHNKHVVENLRQQGVVFIEELTEATDRSRPVIISAHGAQKSVYAEAAALGLKLIDATCPLVEKVHKKIIRLAQEGKNIAVVGKVGHPEIIGTVGQLDDASRCKIIASPQEAEALTFDDKAPVGMVTQTTLSVSDVAAIMEVLQRRFGKVEALAQSDTCYATTHRQAAVVELARHAAAIIVVGSKNSSNSQQLKKIALEAGAAKAFLIDDVSEMPWDELTETQTLGISAGASAPEELVEQILTELKKRYTNLKIHDIIVADEAAVRKSPATA